MWSWIIGKIGLKGLMWGLAGLVITGMITAGTIHYTGLVSSKAELTGQVATLEGEVAGLEDDKRTLSAQVGTLETVLERNRQLAEEQEERIQQLAREAQAARNEARRLNDIFAEHDLTRLTLAKPGLIERRVNSGTARIGELLECASGGTCPTAQ